MSFASVLPQQPTILQLALLLMICTYDSNAQTQCFDFESGNLDGFVATVGNGSVGVTTSAFEGSYALNTYHTSGERVDFYRSDLEVGYGTFEVMGRADNPIADLLISLNGDDSGPLSPGAIIVNLVPDDGDNDPDWLGIGIVGGGGEITNLSRLDGNSGFFSGEWVKISIVTRPNYAALYVNDELKIESDQVGVLPIGRYRLFSVSQASYDNMCYTPLANSPNFSLDDNGVTVTCEGAAVGDIGYLDGVEYLAVDNTTLRTERDAGRDMATVCTSHVTDLSRLFLFKETFNDDIRSWDVSAVVTTERLFEGAISFNQDLSSWNTSSLLHAVLMFFGATSFNADIGGWDVSSLINGSGMLARAVSFDHDISGWDLSSAVDLYGMFEGASSFNQNIGSWDVSSVSRMGSMFYGASRFSQDLSLWCVEKISIMEVNFANGSGLSSDQLPMWGVGCTPPAASFKMDYIGPTGESAVFDASGSSDPDGDPLTYLWDFGELGSSSEIIVSAPFNISSSGYPGSIDVTLTVSDPKYSTSVSYAIDIPNQPPHVAIGSSALSGSAPLSVSFEAKDPIIVMVYPGPYPEELSYSWDFGDGTTSVEKNPTHSFTRGTYDVTLNVCDALLCSSETVQVSALNQRPQLSVRLASVAADGTQLATTISGSSETATITGAHPLTVTFDASASTDPNSDPLIFGWNFRDGSASSAAKVSHTFGTGQYDVGFTVSDGELSSSAIIRVNAINVAPIAKITASERSGQAPLQLAFDGGLSADANGDALTYQWDMGDGSNRQGQSVSHFYGAAGEYTVVLTASDGALTGTDSLTVSIASGVDTESLELPETFVLKAAYPNPFNPTTTVTYGLPAASEVRITATDLLGRQAATLVAGDMKAAGYHTVQFNADGLASGTYLIRMEAGDFVATQQVVLLK